jgi:hypothetical protein
MGALGVVLDAPRLDPFLRLGEGHEVMQVQALVAQLAVEALDKAILYRVTRPDKGQRHTVACRPLIQRLTHELGLVVTLRRLINVQKPWNGVLPGGERAVPALFHNSRLTPLSFHVSAGGATYRCVSIRLIGWRTGSAMSATALAALAARFYVAE